MVEHQNKAEAVNSGVLEPVSKEEFFSDYWEKQPLHIARSSGNPFENLISVSAIEDLLSTNELYYPSVQLSQAGQTIPAQDYTNENNKIVSGRVTERYHRGSTIVLTHMHKRQKELMSLCRNVQRSFMMQCQTNVYLSPAGNQGFNPHFDTHNVFILQVDGSKTFNFYSGGSRYPTSADSFNSEIHEVGIQTESIALSAGDTLYIPRGVTHDAIASNDNASLHVTLGVYPILMHELLQEMLHIGIASDENLRKSIPQALWLSEDSTTSTEGQLSSILHRHINEDVVRLALSRLRDNVALEASKDCQNAIHAAKDQPLQSCSVVQVHSGSILQLERLADTLKLRTYGAVLEFIDPFGSAVEWLAEHPDCKADAIPTLDSDQRMALLEKLREHDIVTLS